MPSTVDLWLVDLDRVVDPCLSHAWRGVLDAPERARLERITHPSVKRQYLATRALVRDALSRYEAVAPSEWRFGANARGCPHIDQAATGYVTDLRFNVSHTDGCLVLAITRGVDVGVDVEDSQRSSDTARIAHRFFADPEVAALRALPESAQRERFFAYWTLKEAYIKGRGLGLAVPLGRFWFDVDSPPRIGFDNDPALGDPPARWWFARLQASERHPIGLAVAAGAQAAVSITAQRGVPLGTYTRVEIPVLGSTGSVAPG